MGNPPKRIVMNKLIRRYFKGDIKNVGTQEAAVLKQELLTCWDQHGVNSPKCTHLINAYDKGWAMDVIFREKYMEQVKQYPNYFEKMFPPKINKMHRKGREADAFWL
jgi:hypothetical protein